MIGLQEVRHEHMRFTAKNVQAQSLHAWWFISGPGGGDPCIMPCSQGIFLEHGQKLCDGGLLRLPKIMTKGEVLCFYMLANIKYVTDGRSTSIRSVISLYPELIDSLKSTELWISPGSPLGSWRFCLVDLSFPLS